MKVHADPDNLEKVKRQRNKIRRHKYHLKVSSYWKLPGSLFLPRFITGFNMGNIACRSPT